MIPQKFGVIMTVGLLLLFVQKGALRFVVAGVGYLALVLTTIRTAWLNWLVGLLILFASLKRRWQNRIIISMIVASVLLLPLTMIEPFSSVIVSRRESFSQIEEDGSYNARLEGYNELIKPALSEFFGQSLGARLLTEHSNIAAYDNGLLVLLFSLVWFGSTVYLGGITLIVRRLLLGNSLNQDQFAIALRAICLSTFLVQLGFNPFMAAEFALPIWVFASPAMASQKYHRRQNV